jgi:hypothetical protein
MIPYLTTQYLSRESQNKLTLYLATNFIYRYHSPITSKVETVLSRRPVQGRYLIGSVLLQEKS